MAAGILAATFGTLLLAMTVVALLAAASSLRIGALIHQEVRFICLDAVQPPELVRSFPKAQARPAT